MQILVVHPQSSKLRQMTIVLESMGHQVYSTSDMVYGDEILKQVEIEAILGWKDFKKLKGEYQDKYLTFLTNEINCETIRKKLKEERGTLE
ncbi:MAG: hypothetical protein AAGA18_05290 [Verrucomicrobiota bacterium]